MAGRLDPYNLPLCCFAWGAGRAGRNRACATPAVREHRTAASRMSPKVNMNYKNQHPGLSADTEAALPTTKGLSIGSPRERGLRTCWAQTTDEVREAQRLRFGVFADELGAKLETSLAGHDIDRFDDYCEHLLVRDAWTDQVVGTYRVLLPAQARRLGSSYCDGEFDLSPLAAMRPRMVELGRSCVRAGHRRGGVLLSLWTALAEFMLGNRLDCMIGCASIPLNDGQAASIWRRLRNTHLAAPPYQVRPRLPWPVDDAAGPVQAEPPALIKGYLRMGATVLGPPAWDPAFNSADLLMMMRTADLPARYLRNIANA
jgi:putative hemolysin